MKRQTTIDKQVPPIADNGLIALALVHVDALLERIRTSKLKAFETSLLDQLKRLSTSELKIVKSSYARTYEDLQAAAGGDKFYLEAYSNYEKDQLKLAIALFKCLQGLKHDDKTKGRRFGNHGPRKRKQKPPEEIVKKVLFLSKDKETGISSLLPVDLVGADLLWVYNTRTRKLGAYRSGHKDGLTAKGTTVLNYDEKTSFSKTIRKPKAQISEFISKSPLQMQKFWDAIRAVPQEISPRLNRDTLILKAIRNS